MIEVFESILPVFLLVLLGFGLKASGFIPTNQWQAVEELCFWLLFPALLATTLMRADLGNIDMGAFSLALVLSIATVSSLVLLSWPLLKQYWRTRRGQFSTIFQTTTRWHGFIALAIVFKLYPQQSALVAIAFAVMVPILQITNIVVLAAFSDSHQPTFKQISKTIVTNPIIWGIIVGLSFNFGELTLWTPLMDSLDLLGRAALGASLLALGAGLKICQALRPSRELVISVIGKLWLMPTVMFFFGIANGLTGDELSILLVCGAVPTAMNGYIFARKMGGDAELYAATASVQTLLSFLTIPLFLWLAQLYEQCPLG